jgi:hypothetical protein
VSRRARRLRAQITATVLPATGDGALLVCRTRDVSEFGMALDTDADLVPGTQVAVMIMDPERGAAIEILGEISRTLAGAPGVGIRLQDPPEDWLVLIDGLSSRAPTESRPARRLRVLVVGDGQRQRGALALYVTSGWDVLFASDLDGAREALAGVDVDAVVAEHDAADPRWGPIVLEAHRLQPSARRVVRGRRARAATGQPVLAPAPEIDPEIAAHVDRFVDPAGGLDALLDALTADLPRRRA